MIHFHRCVTIALSLLMATCFINCSGGGTPEKATKTEQVVLVLENTLATPRIDSPIAFERNSLEEVFGQIPEGKVPVAVDEAGNEIPSQTDDLNLDGKWDEWALVYSLPASEKVELAVALVDPSALAAYPQRAAVHFGRRMAEEDSVKLVTHTVLGKSLPAYNKNQMDGPAWESELVGYRLYFDGRNARDVFGKQQPAMVLHTVGKSEAGIPIDNYHVLEPWGRDILGVGSSLGAGGIALEDAGELHRLGILQGATEDVVDSTVYERISNGPVRAVFSVNYHGWEVNGEQYDVKNTISIWAGQYYYQNKLTLLGNFEGKKNIVIGMVNSNNDQPLVFEDNVAGFAMMATHDKQTYNKEYFMGLGMLLPRTHFVEQGVTPDEGASINATYTGKLAVENGKPVTYRVFSGWELQDANFTKSTFFFDMVRGKAEELGTPVNVNFEKRIEE